MSVPFGYPVVLLDGSAFAPINLNSSPATGTFIKAGNRALTPSSYTFVTTTDQYMKIFSAQCDRVSTFISGELEQLDRSDDNYNEEVVDKIAFVINLVGEPAYMTASLEAKLLQEDRLRFGKLLLAIGSSTHKETEALRAEFLGKYATSGDPRIRNAALRALGRMKTDRAKSFLESARKSEAGESAYLAAALLR
jgi:hypothetical protein